MKQHKPSLLILSSSFPRSADDETCGYVRELARSLAAEFDVQVLAPADVHANDSEGDCFKLSRSKSFLPASLDPLQASKDLNGLLSSNVAIKFFTLISLFAFFISAVKLARRAEVICSHWLLPSGLIGAIIAGLFHQPHIVIEHSGALHLLMRRRGGRLMARFIVWRSHRIITVSHDLKKKLLALCPEAENKIDVIPMGIRNSFERLTQKGFVVDSMNEDWRRSRRVDAKTLTESQRLAAHQSGRAAINTNDLKTIITKKSEIKILFIGRLIEIKGVDVLLKALATLPNAQLLIAGEGEQREALARLAEKLNVDAVFLGQIGRREKARLLASSDALVIASRVLPDGRTEGMPVVALEALAAGCPLIASSVGGLSEILIDGQNGLLFAADNYTELAAKIKLLCDDQELRKRLAINARQTAQAFDWQIIGAQFSAIIKDSLITNGSVESFPSAADLKL